MARPRGHRGPSGFGGRREKGPVLEHQLRGGPTDRHGPSATPRPEVLGGRPRGPAAARPTVCPSPGPGPSAAGPRPAGARRLRSQRGEAGCLSLHLFLRGIWRPGRTQACPPPHPARGKTSAERTEPQQSQGRPRNSFSAPSLQSAPWRSAPNPGRGAHHGEHSASPLRRPRPLSPKHAPLPPSPGRALPPEPQAGQPPSAQEEAPSPQPPAPPWDKPVTARSRPQPWAA